MPSATGVCCAVAGVLLSLNSALWFGAPTILVIGIGLYLWRAESVVRMTLVVTGLLLARTFLGGAPDSAGLHRPIYEEPLIGL